MSAQCALLLCVMVSASAGAQTITTANLPGLRITLTGYDPNKQKLAVELTCESESPITAWSVNFTRRYSSGQQSGGAQTDDHIVQLAYDDHDPATSTGVCYQGQQRSLSFGIEPASRNGILEAINLRVAAAVSADNTVLGDEQSLALIRRGRLESLAHIRDWIKILEAISAAPDIPAEARRLRAQKLKESPRSITAEFQARDLGETLQRFEHADADPHASINFLLRIARRQEAVYQSALRER